MNYQLAKRLVTIILADDTFTADDLTGYGTVTVNGDHDPNGAQNAIGSFIRTAAANGWIQKTGRVSRSQAPHRKGGLNQEWQPTPKGRAWAQREADAESRIR